MRRWLAILLFAAVTLTSLYLCRDLADLRIPPEHRVRLSYVLRGLSPTVTELGNPSADTYDEKKLNSRNPWDITVFDNKVFIGGGDYGENTGPVNVWFYDLITEEWKNSGQVNDEAVMRFVELDGRLVILGADPKADWEYGSFYTFIDGKWETSRKVPYGVHMFDCEQFGDQTFYAIGTSKGDQSPVQVTADGVSFSSVDFLADGVSILKNDTNTFTRCYSLFLNGDELYALCYRRNPDSVDISFYRFDGTAFQFVSTTPELQIKSTVISRQHLFNAWECLDGRAYFSVGNLYATSDFTSVELLPTPDGSDVHDLMVFNGELLVLTSLKLEDGTYINSIKTYTEDNGWGELCSFNHKQSAMSFAYSNSSFYVGLGRRITDSPTRNDPLNGTIIKISYNN